MNGTVKFGDWISGGWELFRKEWQTWTLLSLLFLTPILLVIVAGAFIVAGIVQDGLKDHFGLVIGSVGLIAIAIALFASVATAGLYRAAFRQLEGHPISVADLFSATDVMLRVFSANVILFILTLIGVVMCYVPALIVGGLLYFTIPLIVRKEAGVMEALFMSYELTKKDWIMFSLFAFVVGLIAQVGVYACYVGIVFSLPLAFTTAAVAYRDCFEPDLRKRSSVDEWYTKSCRVCGASIPSRAVFCEQCGSGQV